MPNWNFLRATVRNIKKCDGMDVVVHIHDCELIIPHRRRPRLLAIELECLILGPRFEQQTTMCSTGTELEQSNSMVMVPRSCIHVSNWKHCWRCRIYKLRDAS